MVSQAPIPSLPYWTFSICRSKPTLHPFLGSRNVGCVTWAFLPFGLSLGTRQWQQVSQVVLVVKNLPAMQEIKEMWVQSLGWEDPLEKSTTTHSSILDWEIPWTEKSCRLQSMESQRVRYN